MLGTQQINKNYSLAKMAHETKILGSPIMKFRDRDEGVQDVLRDPDFTHYFIWFRSHGKNFVSGHVDEATEYQETYNYAKHLLETFNGTNKSFFLGNWEGDWYLLPQKDKTRDAPQERINGMIKWINIRFRAVEDARRDVTSDAKVYYYVEMNRVTDAYYSNMKRLVNEVLPHVTTDFISLSSYEMQDKPQDEIEDIFRYIERNANFSTGEVAPLGRRIFIGEFGIPAARFSFDGEKHRDANVDVYKKYKELGCPFILYWALYNNEYKPDGTPKGLWLIDDKDQKTPLYYYLKNTHGV